MRSMNRLRQRRIRASRQQHHQESRLPPPEVRLQRTRPVPERWRRAEQWQETAPAKVRVRLTQPVLELSSRVDRWERRAKKTPNRRRSHMLQPANSWPPTEQDRERLHHSWTLGHGTEFPRSDVEAIRTSDRAWLPTRPGTARIRSATLLMNARRAVRSPVDRTARQFSIGSGWSLLTYSDGVVTPRLSSLANVVPSPT